MHCACAYCCLRDTICKLQQHGLTCSGRVGHLHDDPGNTKVIQIDCGKWRETAASFITWLDTAEKTVCEQKQVSRVLERVLAEMDKQEALENEINRGKSIMNRLGKQATILFDQCFQKDDSLLKDLVRVLKMRWERVLTKSRERSRALDIGYKQASDYENSWKALVSWLEAEERALDYLAKQTSSADNNQSKLESLKAELAKSKRCIKAKKGQYDSVVCSGNALREKAPEDDVAELKQMSDRLEQLWSIVGSKSEMRQKDLDKSLEKQRAESPQRRSTSAEPTFGAGPKRSTTPEERKDSDHNEDQKPRKRPRTRSSTDSIHDKKIQKSVSFM
uniref:Dystonin n=1 Tax=Lygus hesperus TaxID=30085 RepID=A0A0A9WMJ4_LYGHE